jgi:hypothetical protein
MVAVSMENLLLPQILAGTGTYYKIGILYFVAVKEKGFFT